ncbi:hypothetical protein ACEOPL_10995 [Pseudomonas aeruginosa]|nr:hypothetical protein [Pseudomonas aeruginosa]
MGNPLNPLDWINSAQDWFTKTEKSSGFRPLLVGSIITSSIGAMLLYTLNGDPEIKKLAMLMIIGLWPVFGVIFSIKSFTDPDFCRSESHVQAVRKMELEVMGSETKQIKGEVLDQIPHTQVIREPLQINADELKGVK